MRLEHQEIHAPGGSSHGYASVGFDNINPFVSREAIGGSFMERFLRANDNIKIDLSDHHQAHISYSTCGGYV